MLRCSVILATVVALLLGSLGLPVSLYSCEMMKVRGAVISPCGRCCPSGTSGSVARRDGEHDRRGDLKSPPCCSREHKLLRADMVALPWAGALLPRPVLACSVLPVLPMRVRSVVDARSKFLMEHPPPLASHAQDAYLFNSTFLI
jgi:hypothetical protein